MMTYEEVISQLKSMGNETTARLYDNREMTLEIFGVKVGDIKKIQKKIKKDHDLSLALYQSGIYEAMYLAGLIADEGRIQRSTLDLWARQSGSYLIAEYTVPWVASETEFGLELALKWIEDKEDLVKAAGWSCLTNIVMITQDDNLDHDLLAGLLKRVLDRIHQADNRERYTMNGFVIGLAASYKPLLDEAKAAAQAIGRVEVYMGKTACKVPYAPDYIKKIEDKGYIGRKKKHARC